MHFFEERMPSAEKKNKKKIRHKGGETVPNGDAGKPRRHVRDYGGGDAEDCDCDAEPNSENPLPYRNGRREKEREGALKPGNKVNPAYECHEKQTSDYN